MRVDTRGSPAKSHSSFFGHFVFWRRFNMWWNVVKFATVKAFQSFNFITKSHLLFPCTFSHFKINSQRITLPACLRACCDFSLSKLHKRTMTRKYTPSPSMNRKEKFNLQNWIGSWQLSQRRRKKSENYSRTQKFSLAWAVESQHAAFNWLPPLNSLRFPLSFDASPHLVHFFFFLQHSVSLRLEGRRKCRRLKALWIFNNWSRGVSPLMAKTSHFGYNKHCKLNYCLDNASREQEMESLTAWKKERIEQRTIEADTKWSFRMSLILMMVPSMRRLPIAHIRLEQEEINDFLSLLCLRMH